MSAQIEEQSSVITPGAPPDAATRDATGLEVTRPEITRPEITRPEITGTDATANTEWGIHAVAELMTTTLSGLHRLDDHFVCMNATLGDDGCIELTATLVRIAGEDVTIRVLLTLSEPDDRPIPIGPGPGSAG